MQVQRVFIGSVCQQNAINAAADKETTRETMASFYEDCLRCPRDSVDWKAVNAAILARWPKGLTFIKTRA